jgi:hypothetical protein
LGQAWGVAGLAVASVVEEVCPEGDECLLRIGGGAFTMNSKLKFPAILVVGPAPRKSMGKGTVPVEFCSCPKEAFLRWEA